MAKILIFVTYAVKGSNRGTYGSPGPLPFRGTKVQGAFGAEKWSTGGALPWTPPFRGTKVPLDPSFQGNYVPLEPLLSGELRSPRTPPFDFINPVLILLTLF